MPRKLRAHKERYDAEAELEAFTMVFTCGHDFFSETGLVDPVRRWKNAQPSSGHGALV
jgi:hypothetical protein